MVEGTPERVLVLHPFFLSPLLPQASVMAKENDAESKDTEKAPVKDSNDGAQDSQVDARNSLYSDADLADKKLATSTETTTAPESATANSSASQNEAGADRAAAKPASVPELSIDFGTPKKDSAQPTKQAEMSADTLASAAKTLSENLRDKQSVEAILRSIPPASKEKFAESYEQATGKKLTDELKKNGHESSIALLDSKEEARNSAWLTGRLGDLSRAGGANSTARNLLEHSIRSNLRGMTDEERTSLDKELKEKTGKGLAETIQASRISDTSKEIAGKIIEKGSALTGEDLRQMAEKGLQSRTANQEQKLLILKEAFAGDSKEAAEARASFMSNDGAKKLAAAFSSDELKQATDYANLGKLHTATFIDMQASKWASNDKGIELALSLMTDKERAQFAAGQKLVADGKDKDPANKPDAEAQKSIDYYNRVHKSLENAATSITSPSRWSEMNQRKVVAGFEDLARNGEKTMISRIASAANNYMPDDPAAILSAIKNFSQKDFELMKDPAYKEQVYKLFGGADGRSPSGFDEGMSTLARKELDKLFGANPATPEIAKDGNHVSLKEAASGFNEFMALRGRNSDTPQSLVLDALNHGKAADFAKLSAKEQIVLNNRIDHLPTAQREFARALFNDLKNGKDSKPGLANELHLDALKGSSKEAVVERLLANKEKLAGDPKVTAAAKSALGSAEDFDKYAKPLIEGKSLSAESLRELHYKAGWVSAGQIKHEGYYNSLKHVSTEEREKILAAEKGAANNDPESQKLLDTTFKNMSKEEREIALNVLKNPNQEYSLQDKIRTRGIGGDIDQAKLVKDFQALGAKEKLDQINEYATKYKNFLPTDLAKGADDSTRKAIELSLPMTQSDLARAASDWAREAGNGTYGNLASTEISIAQTQAQLKSGLLDKLPPETREQTRKEIEAAFQKYVNALRDNDSAKDQYAKDLADKVMTAALTVVAPGVGASLAKLALAAGGAAAARVAVESSVRGSALSQSDLAMAGLFGVADAAGLTRLAALKGAFSSAIEKSVSSLSTAGREKIVSGLETYLAKDGEQKLVEALKREGVAEPGQKAKDILQEYERNAAKIAPAAEAAAARPAQSAGEQLGARVGKLLIEKPEAGPIVRDFIRDAGGQNLDKLVANGAITEAQKNQFSSMLKSNLTELVDKPAESTRILAQMKEISAQMKHLADNAGNPQAAQKYADLMHLNSKRPELNLPMQRLRTDTEAMTAFHDLSKLSARPDLGIQIEKLHSADTKLLNLYRDQITEVASKFKAPSGPDVSGGMRYEYAAQRQTMDTLQNSTDPELKKWIFVPGTSGSTADRMGIDGVFMNVETGKLMPVDFKNSSEMIQGVRYTTFFPRPDGRPELTAGRRYFDGPGAYSNNGLFAEKPSHEDVANRLKDILKRDDRSFDHNLFKQSNPTAKIAFPRMADAPNTRDPAALAAQRDQLAWYTVSGDANPGTPLASFGAHFGKKAKDSATYLEHRVRELQSEMSEAAIRKLRDAHPDLSAAQAKRIGEIEAALKAEGKQVNSSDIVDAFQRFRRAGIEPTTSEDMHLFTQAFKSSEKASTEQLDKLVASSLLSKLGPHVEKLEQSADPKDKALGKWAAGILRNTGSTRLDPELVAMVASDKTEAARLREVIYGFHASTSNPARTRADLVQRAIELLGI